MLLRIILCQKRLNKGKLRQKNSEKALKEKEYMRLCIRS
jgi:hypothetical protein